MIASLELGINHNVLLDFVIDLNYFVSVSTLSKFSNTCQDSKDIKNYNFGLQSPVMKIKSYSIIPAL